MTVAVDKKIQAFSSYVFINNAESTLDVITNRSSTIILLFYIEAKLSR